MINGMHHLGISVSNLERSIEFYTSGLGMELVAQRSFGGVEEGGLYDAIMGLRGAAGRGAMLKLSNLRLELWEFSCPVPKASDPNRPVCDHGLTHFCLELTDIAAHYERLRKVGARFHCPPMDFRGQARATYGRDPDGNVFELFEATPDKG